MPLLSQRRQSLRWHQLHSACSMRWKSGNPHWRCLFSLQRRNRKRHLLRISYRLRRLQSGSPCWIWTCWTCLPLRHTLQNPHGLQSRSSRHRPHHARSWMKRWTWHPVLRGMMRPSICGQNPNPCCPPRQQYRKWCRPHRLQVQTVPAHLCQVAQRQKLRSSQTLRWPQPLTRSWCLNL